MAAKIITEKLYNTKPENLTEVQKETVSALSQIASGLSGVLVGDNTASGITAAQSGKSAVENNYLTSNKQMRYEYLSRKEKRDSLSDKEKVDKLALEREDKENDEHLISACYGQNKSDCVAERKKASEAGKTYDYLTYHMPPASQAGYQHIEEVLQATTEEAINQQRIMDGIVYTFQHGWGLSEEEAKKATNLYIGGNYIVNSLAGVGMLKNFANRVPKGVNANDKLPVVSKTTGYENQTVRISTGAENIALYPKLKKELAQQEKAGFEKVIKNLSVKPEGSVLLLVEDQTQSDSPHLKLQCLSD